jgi:NRPS condensation-like uncharacterized protein
MNNIPDCFPARISDCFTDYLAAFADMIIQLEMEFDKGLDAKRLAKAVDLTLDAEPVLGCRFVNNSYKPYFQRLDTDKRPAFFTANSENEYEAFKSASIDRQNGPQINVCLWHSTKGDRLLLKVAHQVADAAGVKDIAAILSRIYRQLASDPQYRPIPNTKETRSLLQVLRHVPLHAYPRIYLNSVQSTWRTSKPRTVHTLSIPDGPREPLTFVTRLIPSGRVSTLAEYGRSHNATLNDIIAAASLRTLADTGNWNKRSHLSLSTTIDLRRYVPSGRAAAVANLGYSNVEWPDLGTNPGQDFAATLDKVAAITRYGKMHWIGLDIMFSPVIPLCKFMPHARGKELYQKYFEAGIKKHACTHWFTNTGLIEQESVNFGMQPITARILPQQCYPWMPFIFSLSGYNGTLTLVAGAYPTQKETIEKFFDAILKEIPI